jgi:RNA polymerase sigma-70 factor (ECF subfamily)
MQPQHPGGDSDPEFSALIHRLVHEVPTLLSKHLSAPSKPANERKIEEFVSKLATYMCVKHARVPEWHRTIESLEAYAIKSYRNWEKRSHRAVRLRGDLNAAVRDGVVPQGHVFARPDLALESKELNRLLDAELWDMPADTRQVFELNVRKGLSAKEIAEKMGKTEQAVWQHVKRARQRLRAVVSAYDQPGSRLQGPQGRAP